MNKASTTRMHILEKSFGLIYQNGYQATSIDKIIETTQVTKGAFYYHFKDKEKMGLAMIKEVVAPRLDRLLISPIKNADDPLEKIYLTIKKNLIEDTDFDIQYGCPINNLIQEMSPIKESFKSTLQLVIENWKKAIVFELENGKKTGTVNQSIDSNSVAEFIIVSYEGLRGTGKVYQNFKLYESYIKQLKFYLNALR
jgi:TetR/AcrR family transcriptional regulator, transcriptional repressor for nem operon